MAGRFDNDRLAALARRFTDPMARDIVRSREVLEQATRGGSRIQMEEIVGVIAPRQQSLPVQLTREILEQQPSPWSGGDVTADAYFRNADLYGYDEATNLVWMLSPAGRLDLEEVFARRGLNLATGGVLVFRRADGSTSLVGTADTGQLVRVLADGTQKRYLDVDDRGGVGGGGAWNGGTVTNPIRLEPAAILRGYDSGGVERLLLSPASGRLIAQGATDVGRLVVTAPAGDAFRVVMDNYLGIRLRSSDGLMFFDALGNVVMTVPVAQDGAVPARFTIAPTVGATSGAAVPVLTRASVLDALADVDTAGATTGQTLVKQSDGQWRGATIAAGGLDTEAVDDRVAALIVAGAGITKTYDDAAGTLTLAATGGGAGTRDYPITYVSPTAPTAPRTGDFWVELAGRPVSDDPHAELIVSSTAPASPGIGTLWVQA